MPTFTPSHLGKWEELYRDLLEGETMPLTAEGTWMLGKKPGLVAVFDESEPVFIEATPDIARTLNTFVTGGAASEFRSLLAIAELGASAKTAHERARSGSLAERVNKRVSRLRYRVAPAPPGQLDLLAEAFKVVADPRYNGPTAFANAALDALPK